VCVRRVAIAILVLLSPLACSGSTEPGQSVRGTYTLTALTYSEMGHVTDYVAAGVVMSVSLALDGTTTGALHTPAALSEDGEDEDISLEGTWTIDASGTHVDFDFPNAIGLFLSSVPWNIEDSALTFSYVSGPVFMGTGTLTRN
jgi:hypothetical protein